MIPTMILRKIVETALARVADSPNTHMTHTDVPAAREIVVRDIATEVEATIRNQTNNEPWYKSRVLLGSIFAALGALASMGQMWFTDGNYSFEDYWLQLTTLGGSIFAIYGRTIARKPLGE